MKSFNYKTTSFNNPIDSKKSFDSDNLKLKSSNIRVICKNILYLIGIPYEIANEETLIKKEYLGQYGSIQKIIINKSGYLKNESDYPTYSSYITYSSEIEASLALLTLNNSNHFNHKLNTCYGTNKYCNSFLKGMKCINKDCYYLHEHANQNDIINKNDSQTKFQFLEQQKIATKIADIYALDKKQNYIKKGLDMKKEFEKNKIEVFFPTIDTIYEKKFVQDYENEKKKVNNVNNEYYNSKKKFHKDNNCKPNSPSYASSKKSESKLFYSPEIKNFEHLEEEDEDEEYILVRQPSKQKKKFTGNKPSFRKTYYKKGNCKLKYTLEKYRIKYNIKYDEKADSFQNTEAKNLSNSNDSNKINEKEDSENSSNDKNNLTLSDKCINVNLNNISGYNTNESSIQNNQQEDSDMKRNNYKISKKSRFSFVNNNTENIDKKDIFIVPEFIEEILNKKFILLSFNNLIKGHQSEYFSKYFSEEVLLAEECKIIQNWMKTK